MKPVLPRDAGDRTFTTVIPRLQEMERTGELPTGSGRCPERIVVPGRSGANELSTTQGIRASTRGAWVAGWSTVAPNAASSAAS